MKLKHKASIFFASICATAILVLPGCKSARHSAPENADATTSLLMPKADTVAVDQTLEQRLQAMTASYRPWTDVTMNLRAQLQAPAAVTLSAKVGMVRGEWISLSVRMIGFEVAWLWADGDSVFAACKSPKCYLAESTSRILGAAGCTIADLQDLLLGRAFIPGGGTLTAGVLSKFTPEAAADGLVMLVPGKQPEAFEYAFVVDLGQADLAATLLTVGERQGIARYSDYRITEDYGEFAAQTDLQAHAMGRDIAATLRWDLNGARWNTGLTAKPKRPSKGAKRIGLADLARLLGAEEEGR